MSDGAGFRPPPYPYDRLDDVRRTAAAHDGGLVDLSVGTPVDPPTAAVLAAMADADAARSYPASIGTAEYRAAAAGWLDRRLGVAVDPSTEVAACVGTKELVVGLPHWLRLRRPGRSTVLYPAVSYPSYAMGATLAGCRAVPVPMDAQWRLDLGAVDPADVADALCVWVNSPGNPTGALEDLDAVVAWGRANDVVVLSDECYVEFTWDGDPATVLTSGATGVLAVHSLSKRSNLAGVRCGFYAGDAELVDYLREVRKHAGLMVPGGVQRAGAVAWGDDDHVEEGRRRYRRRLERVAAVLATAGLDAPMPSGAFYLWVPVAPGEAWRWAARLAEALGMVVSPGEFYGPQGADHLRVAAVASDEGLALLERRAGLPTGAERG
ncbi:MAG: aminotransferase class I/II-fold pyridoxal phosphate-dependent enzyme [Acidimicrobiia bacterium]|nr:aminotransferase class I/II-fold pyridoxal phosphate-dependent enzyme [Acidimicrobiia bacterium]